MVRATAIVPFPNDRVFLGSAQADSTFIKLDSKPITVLDELLSLAPIVDFCLFDLDKQGRVSDGRFDPYQLHNLTKMVI